MEGCDQLELPRLIGRSSAVAGGQKLDFTFWLVFAGRDTLYCSMWVDTVANGAPVYALRIVNLHREVS